MPELPEVEAVRRHLAPFLTQASIADVDVRRPDLRVPFPRRFRARLVGQTVLSLSRRAKYLLAALSSRDTLIVHLGMSGSFRVDAPGHAAGVVADRDRHDHVVFHLSSGAAITFNDPRRFGLMTLLTPAQLARHPVLSRLGPEPLSPDFDAAALARACRGRKTPLKLALLDQRVVAGIGNIYASEALHVARLSPFRRASTIATRVGRAARGRRPSGGRDRARAHDRHRSRVGHVPIVAGSASTIAKARSACAGGAAASSGAGHRVAGRRSTVPSASDSGRHGARVPLRDMI